MTKHLLTLLAIFALVATLSSSTTGTANAADGNRSKIDKHGREAIASAVANGNANVTLLIAASEAATSSVAAALQGLGGTVRKQDVDIGYIRVDIAAGSAEQASKLPGVLAVDVDEVIPLDDPRPEASGDEPQIDPPGPTTPDQNPYMPTRDIGAPQFVAAHPTWDGRGVTIGILDTGVALDHPALQTTTTGERKIIDWVTLTDPLEGGATRDPMWIFMNANVTVAGGTFTAGGKTYTGAPNGAWKFGVFNESDPLFGGEYAVGCGSDLNRDGICNQTFAILWNGADTVWVDSDTDGSFADESAMRPFKVNNDVGFFGHDNPSTRTKESVPFVVQVDAAANAVNLGIVAGEHGTHVSGIMAGHGLYGGSANGAAPGAKIVSIRVCLFVTGCTAHALIEGMIFAEKTAKVDTINMSIGGLPSLNDGNNARATLYNALIDKYGAQMFISAGNSGNGLNSVGDPSVATKVMSIGAHWSHDSVLSNYGNSTPSAEGLHDFSSRGPREDGGFKPDVVAPGNAVSSVPQWEPTFCLPYSCGPGYDLLNGTSMAAPQATGASALLLSAAFQADIGHKPAQLRQAMRSSARFLGGGYQATDQGFGLINVGAAWSLLSQNVKTADISSAVATHSLLSPFLATPGVGTGIYEREGITTSTAPYRLTYTFSRSDGGNSTYNLSWLGNTSGAFSLPAGVTSVSFSKKGSATLDITVNPGTTAGVKSAILQLDDPTTVGIDYATMNTLVVSKALNAANGYTATSTATANRFEGQQPGLFFQVPDGATAYKNTVTINNNGRFKWFRYHPYGVPIDPSSTGFFGVGSPGVSQTRTTQISPLAGAWEVAGSASRAEVQSAGPLAATANVTVSASAYKVTLSPNPVTQDPTVIGTPYDQTISATNAFASGNMGAGGTSNLASTFATSESIAAGGAQNVHDITVRAGSSSLVVTIGNASDLRADLDLFVYNCTSGTCVLAGQSAGSSANEAVSITNPAQGLWKAVVDPFAVPAGTTTYDYVDSFANAAFGSVTTADPIASHASGTTWSFTSSAKALEKPATGRFLRGAINVRLDTATGSVIGSANFELRNLGP